MDKDRGQLENLSISDEWAFKSGGRIRYDEVRLMSDAYFRISSGLILEIETLYNEKEYEMTENPFEFLVQTPSGNAGEEGENGQNAHGGSTVQIIIHKLMNDVYLKGIGGHGGDGGHGKSGADGGDGGDAGGNDAGGGAGGNGSNGSNGGNGGNGGQAPTIRVNYTPVNDAKLIVLSREDEPCKDCLAYGGIGGKGGEPGEGGIGGKGGLNGDGKTRASNGSSGSMGNRGNSGNNGKDVTVVIHQHCKNEY